MVEDVTRYAAGSKPEDGKISSAGYFTQDRFLLMPMLSNEPFPEQEQDVRETTYRQNHDCLVGSSE